MFLNVKSYITNLRAKLFWQKSAHMPRVLVRHVVVVVGGPLIAGPFRHW